MAIVVEVTHVEPVANHSLCHAHEFKTGKLYQFWVEGQPNLVGRLFSLSETRLKPLYEDSWPVWGVKKRGEVDGNTDNE